MLVLKYYHLIYLYSKKVFCTELPELVLLVLVWF